MAFRKIRTKLIIGFLTVTMILVIVSGIAFYQLNMMHQELREMVEIEFELFSINQQIAFNVAERNSNIRGYLLSGAEEYLGRFTGLTVESDELFERLLALDDTDDNELVYSRVKQWEGVAFNSVITTYQSGIEAMAIALANGPLAQDGEIVINASRDAATEREDRLRAINEDLMLRQQQISFILLGATALGIIISILLGMFISSAITKPIKSLLKIVSKIAEGDLKQEVMIKSADEIGQLGQAINKMITNLKNLIGSTSTIGEGVAVTSQQLSASSQQVSVAAEEVSTTITEVAKSATEQAITIERSTETINTISNNMDIVKESINSINEASKITLISAEEGMKDAKNAVDKMNSIQSASKKASNVILKLNHGSKEIEKIVDTIGAIAGQTNLLALNAAIEAARAGDVGRGFAVVAEEIRKLAEQSASSTNQITKLILAIQTQVQDAVASMDMNSKEVEIGVEIVNQSSEKFERILEEIDGVVQQVETATGLTEQVAENIDEIVHDFKTIAAISQDTAASSEEVAAGSQEQTATMEEIANSAASLASSAEELRNSIAIFKI